MDPITGESSIVAYEETPIEDKLIDYSGRRWSEEAMHIIKRRIRKEPPESFSTASFRPSDERLISSYQVINRRF